MAESRLELVRRAFERFDEGQVEAALELLSEDLIIIVPPALSAEPDVYEGHDGALRYFAGFDGLIDEVRFEPIEVFEQDGAVIVWLRMTGRGAASGIDVEQEAAVVTWVENGKVSRIEPYADLEDARAAARAAARRSA